ncbi:hypothetical protein [Nocardia sp. NPDC049707]
MAELVAAFEIPALPRAPLFARDYLDPYRTLTSSNADTPPAVPVRQAS